MGQVSPNHRLLKFQSSPSPKTGRYCRACLIGCPLFVPILTQSEDWALFQLRRLSRRILRSNPHPVRRLGAIERPQAAVYYRVPILTQSEDWALSSSPWC